MINNKEKVNFIPQEDEIYNLRTEYRRPIVRENQRLETIQRPGREIYREQYIQPIVQKENVDLRINRGEDREIQLNDIHEQPKVNNVVRQQTINVPGQEIITQPIVQEYY